MQLDLAPTMFAAGRLKLFYFQKKGLHDERLPKNVMDLREDTLIVLLATERRFRLQLKNKC